jgi:hypothetical protein
METKHTSKRKIKHDTYAPFWAIGLVILCGTGLATVWFDLGHFWSGYVLDMTGPAWNYILFRGLFTSYTENTWTRFFTPRNTLLIFLVVCFGIEISQYLGLYESTFDPGDFLAYVSILVPLFLLDSTLLLENSIDNKDVVKTSIQ